MDGSKWSPCIYPIVTHLVRNTDCKIVQDSGLISLVFLLHVFSYLFFSYWLFIGLTNQSEILDRYLILNPSANVGRGEQQSLLKEEGNCIAI